MHEGHRKRMLEREEEGALQDHELLEIILFNPIPRKNTNEIAHRLLATFGSLDRVLSAGEEELVRIEGVGKHTAQYLASIGELVTRVASQRAPTPSAVSFGNFSSYVRERFSGLTEEVVDLFCLDKTDKIKHTARFASGDPRHVEISMDEVGRVLLSHRPFGVVVSHNHPGAPCRPSPEDDRFTAQLQLLCSLNGVKLRDHIIAGDDGLFSYFTSGRLEAMEKAYSVENIIDAKSIT